MIKLSRFGSSPVQRVPELLANSMHIPIMGTVAIPANDEYYLAALFDKEAASFYRNTYYSTITIISTTVKDAKGNCLMLIEDLPTDTYLLLLKKTEEFMGVPVCSPTEFRPLDLNKMGLLIITTPQPLEQADKFLVN